MVSQPEVTAVLNKRSPRDELTLTEAFEFIIVFSVLGQDLTENDCV